MDVKLPKEFVTFEDGNFTYFQDRDPGNIDPYVTSYIKSHIKEVNGKLEFYYIAYYWNSLGEPIYKEIICNLS
ncbi:MAG: hypothetical protein R2774_13440 [Saprospiraceae bacterium]